MKKFLVVLLSLGLLVAFGATASATTVKFGGTYYVVGVYDNNQTLADTDRGTSRAFFYQRIRIQPVFQIAEGLTFTSRFDAMETQWGNTDWRGGVDAKYSSRRQQQNAGNPKIQESFEWERGYVGFATPIGLVQAGIMASGAWGTDFGNDTQSRPRARIDTKIGPMAMGFVYEKEFESDSSNLAGFAGNKFADADNDTYSVYGIFNWKGGNAGLLYKYWNRRASRVTANNRAKFMGLLPYVKANFGPVYLEAEVVYAWGKIAEFDSGATPDRDIQNLGAYGKLQVNLGPAYFGGLALWSQGDDGSDPSKLKTGPGSQDLEFGLILGNDALQTWESSNGTGGANGVAFDSGKQNVLMYGMYGGFKPTPKLKMELTLLSARRDKVTLNMDKHMGIEFDATAEYKIYDNLSYMVGAGYLWTGDYFKGANAAGSIGNNYLLLNKLSLSF